MDVNKPSPWKSGAGGGGGDAREGVDGGGGWRGMGVCVWGGLLLLSFSLSYVSLTLSVIWTKSLQRISRCKINSICVLIRQSAIICRLRPSLCVDPG